MKIILNYIHYIVFILVSRMCYKILTHSISNSSGIKPYINPPQMIPSTKELIYKKNDRVEVACEADEPILWTYPKLQNRHNFGSHIEIKTIHKGVHRSNLIVHNATFADTGFYRCYRNCTNEGRRMPSSTYVYVYDLNHLLIFWEHNVFNVYELNTTTLSWCRPTSPNINVAILLEGKTMIMNSTRVSHPFTYDPRYGFTVENIYENIVEGTYVCKATGFPYLDYKMIEIKLSAPPLILFKIEKEFYKPDEPISIECHISTNSSALGRLDWNNEKIETKQIESNAVLSYNTTAKQSGKFYCIAQNRHGRRYETLKVFVTDLNKGCDMWHNESNKSIYEGSQMTLECGATKQKYNNKIQWYFNNSLLDINQRPKDYLIVNYATSYSYRSLLVITDTKYANTGNYECRVEKESKSCGQIDVAIEGKPLLSCSNFDQNKTYGYHEMIHLKCSAVSNPLPSNVECIYEAANRSEKISTTLKEFDRQTVMFNLTLLLYTSGKIRCNATNNVGTSEMSLNITDKPRVQIQHEYEYNMKMTVKCVVLSFSPIESIDWYFIRNDSIETKLNESLFTTTACSTKNDLCTETILTMPADESGTLRCEASSDSEKYSSVHYVHVIKQTDSTYYSSSCSCIWSITEIVLSTLLTLSLIIFPVIIIVLCVKINRMKNQELVDTEEIISLRIPISQRREF